MRSRSKLTAYETIRCVFFPPFVASVQNTPNDNALFNLQETQTEGHLGCNMEIKQ